MLAFVVAKHMSAYDDNGFDVADDLDQAVGLQHAELVADIQDKPFFQDCLIAGPFGTVDNPVKIESVLGYRIVGCTGASRLPLVALVALCARWRWCVRGALSLSLSLSLSLCLCAFACV